ncbi:hypothetical protein [Sorangium sp. So ce1153]|uniref:hypothetical protein n=1 Tax=Sorangium sp. So ce1153 TaxID=3133333 RepID=UPI003F60C8AA
MLGQHRGWVLGFGQVALERKELVEVVVERSHGTSEACALGREGPIECIEERQVPLGALLQAIHPPLLRGLPRVEREAFVLEDDLNRIALAKCRHDRGVQRERHVVFRLRHRCPPGSLGGASCRAPS